MMSGVARESEITVHYSKDFQVSGKRVLRELSSIDGVGGGYRNSSNLVLPIIPIIAKKACGSSYQLLNSGDTRITKELSEFNSATMLECLLIRENIEQVRAVCGEVYPQICTKIPIDSFLQKLAKNQLIGQVVGEFFGCGSSHKNAHFSVAKLAELLGPNGPSKATINRVLKRNGSDQTKNFTAEENVVFAENGKITATAHKPLKTGDELLESPPTPSAAIEKKDEYSQKAKEKWHNDFNRKVTEFSEIESSLKEIEHKTGKFGLGTQRFYQRIMEAQNEQTLLHALQNISEFIKQYKS